MERDLRENLFGEQAWRALEATARRFIATGEKLFREHRADPAFDFGPVVRSFAKALEVQCRASSAVRSPRQRPTPGRSTSTARPWTSFTP